MFIYYFAGGQIPFEPVPVPFTDFRQLILALVFLTTL